MILKDLKRLKILTEVKERRLKQGKGARILGISTRQFRRLLRKFRVKGPKGVISKKIGAKGHRRLSERKKDLILDFFRDPDHYDFGPTLTQEYLVESGAPFISVTAVRNAMIEKGLWHPKAIRELNIHLSLYRIAENMHRERIELSRRLLSQWVVAAGLALYPLDQAMKDKILEGDRLLDESPVDLFDSPKMATGYMWVLVGGVGADPPYRFYR